MEYHLTLPLKEEDVLKLKAGDFCYLTGEIYTGRDAAHKRFRETLERGENLPINIKNEIIYYMGPTPAKPGEVIGSAGPTTAGRMDVYTPELLDLGMRGMIGKGKRTEEVRQAVVRNKAVYFAAVGGAGAVLSACITASEVVCYEDLGTEAVRRMTIKDFPVFVAMDATGACVYD